MEPERKIEKWLRAFAKKRRDQAPDSSEFALHPATRRLLQGEVRRQFSSPERKPASFLQNFWRFSFRPVEVLVVVAIIALFAALLLPSLSKAKIKSQSISAMTNLRQIGLAAILYAEDHTGCLPMSYGAITNYLHGDAVTIDPVSGERFIYVGGGQQLSNLKPTESVLAYSPTDKKSRSVLFADGHVELANGKRFAELTNRGLVQLALADVPARSRLAEAPATPPPAAAPVASLPPAVAATPPVGTVMEAERLPELAAKKETSKNAGLGIELARADSTKNQQPVADNAPGRAGEPSAEASARIFGFVTIQTNALSWGAGNFQSFASTNIASSRQYGFKRDDVSGKAVPVLTSFQMQQSGTEIRVVDNDGSVYFGYVQPAGAHGQSEVATGVTKSNTNESRSLLTLDQAVAQSGEKDMREGKGAEPAVQTYYFRVAGTNQTLKQSVVFAGNFLAQNATFGGTALMVTHGTSVVSSDNLGGGGGSGRNFDGLAQPWSLLNARISGTVVIGGTNQIEINAVPVAP